MKFEIGDKIKGTRNDIEGCEGIIERIRKTGYSIRITKTGHKTWQGGLDSDFRIGCLLERNTFWEGGLKLISSHNKVMKNKKVKYILKYDVSSSEDPYEEFATLEEVKKRIEELISDGEELIMSSVRVYEVKSIAKVETKIVF